MLGKEFFAAYFSDSAHWIYPAIPFWPAKFLWIGLLWTWPVFPCRLRTFFPCCFHDSFLAWVFCEFDYDMPRWWSVFVESNGGPLCFLDFDVCVFPQVRKVFRYDLLTYTLLPLFCLSSFSGTPMILMLFLFNESLISLILKSCSFALISLFFLLHYSP